MSYKIIKGKNKIRGEQTFVDTISGSIISASYFVGNGSLLTNVYANSASFSVSSSYAQTASYALNVPVVNTSSLLTTASVSNATITFTKGDSSTFPITLNNVTNASTASYVLNAISASYATTASYASNSHLLDGRDSTTFAGTGSNIFIGDQTITGNVNISGIVTANELHITYTTSSVVFTSGSTKFGNSADDTHQFTGSIFAGIISGTTGQLTNLSSSYISASHIDLGQYIDFYTAGTNPAYQQGRLYYNVDTQDPAFYTDIAGVGINIGQQTAVKVKNSSDITISKGKLVHIIGGAGANPLIATASWENDNNSANTLGMAMNTMNQNDFGYILLNGVIEGVNTQGLIAGQIIYLSSSGDYTGTKPQAPLHAVKVGEVIRVQQNNGAIFVNINNGQEINELHDVRITSASVGDLLTYSTYNGSNVWVNTKTLSGSYVITGSLTVSSSATFTNIGPAVFSGTINANNTISGTTAQFSSITASVLSASSLVGINYVSDSGSLLTTASVSDATITFTKGDGSTFPTTIDNVVNASTASYATQAGNSNTININSFGSNFDSYLLMSNVLALPGVAIGGDSDLKYNSGTNVLTVANINATTITGSHFGTSSYATLAATASYYNTSSLLVTASISNATITLNKGDGTTFPLTVNNVVTAQTASYVLNAVSSSFATTAGNGGVTQIIAGSNVTISPSSGTGSVTISTSTPSGSNATATFTTSSTWVFTHNMNNRFPVIQTLDSSYNVIIPQNIVSTDLNTTTITFPTNESGFAVATLGGIGVSSSFATTAATSSFINQLNQNVVITGTLNVSSNITGSIVAATNNGNGTNFKVGDDAWIGDVNLANTMQIMGQSVTSSGYVRFGNGASNPIIGSSGTSTLEVTGALNVSGSLILPNRTSFSVYGSGTTTNLSTTQNGDGTLNSNNYATTFYQGSGFDSSTGVFTAPVAGLYHVTIVGRNSGYSSGISQLACIKNNSNAAGGVLMIEWASSSTMNHTGGAMIYKLAVGDTLRLKVLAGQVNFDGNDNWSVAYIG